MTTDKSHTPKEKGKAFSKEADVAMDMIADALRRFLDGEITRKELKSLQNEPDRILKELQPQTRNGRGRK